MEKQQRKRRNKRILSTGVLVGGICSMILFAGSPVAAAVADSSQKLEATPQAELAKLLSEPFTYQRENRSNPFMPFVKKQKVATVSKKGVKLPEEELTGMQLFEPGQLHLVSIVFADSKSLAMVQDSVGKGYIIREGTKIGRRGVVEKIMANVVVLKQWSLTFSGQKRYKNIEMVLRKEGDNP